MSALQHVQRWAWRLYHVDENSKATDIGLLILRVLIAACLFYHHGGEKFYSYHELLTHPVMDPIGIGVVPSTLFAGFADGICSLLVLIGLFSRYAAFFCLVCLNTVWWIIDHGMQRLLWMRIPPAAGAAGAAGRAAQAAGSGAARMAGGPGGPGGNAAHMAAQGAQHVGQMAAQAGPQIARVVHSLPNYLNVVIYILGFLVIFIAGPGRYSLDNVIESRSHKKASAMAAASAD